MDDDLREAFEGSIRKWERLVEDPSGIVGPCPMCVYWYTRHAHCGRCPLTRTCDFDVYGVFIKDRSLVTATVVLESIKSRMLDFE